MKKRFDIALDMKRAVSNREFEVVEGDNGNELTVTLTDNGAPVDLTGCSVLAVFSHSKGIASQSTVEGGGVSVGGDGGNVITVELFTPSFSPGMVECEIQVYSGTGDATELVTSAKFNFKCRRGIFNSDTLPAEPEYSVLCGLIQEVNAAAAAVAAVVDEIHSVPLHAPTHLPGGTDALSISALGGAVPSRDFAAAFTPSGWVGAPNMPHAEACEYADGEYTLTLPASFDADTDDCVAFTVDEPANGLSAELYSSASNSSGYINASGAVTARTGNYCTDYIGLDPEKTYMYSGFGSNFASSYIAYYTSAHAFISGTLCSELGADGKLTVPGTAAYVRFTLYTDYVSTFSLKTYLFEPLLINIGAAQYLLVDELDAPLMPDWAADDEIVLELTTDEDATETYLLAYVSTEQYELIAPFTQTAEVAGLTAADDPFVDVSLSQDPSAMLDELTSWARISDIHTLAGGIEAVCLVSPPTVRLTLSLKVVD